MDVTASESTGKIELSTGYSQLRASVADLIADPVNARKHDKKNLDAIKSSLSKFGQQKPIVITSSKIVLAGNGTLHAARELGWQDIWVHITDLEGFNQAAYAIADNRSAELASWDNEILGKTLDALKAENFDLIDLGFDANDLLSITPEVVKPGLTDDDSVPDIDQNIHGVVMGDLWQLENHRLLCGDSTNIQHVEKLMDGEKADMVFTDPPYGMKLDVNYDGMFGAADSSHKPTGNRFKAVEGDNVQYDPSPILYFQCQLFIWGCDYFYTKLPAGGSFVGWDKRNENLDKVPGNPSEFCWAYPPVRRCTARVLWSGHHGMQGDDKNTRIHPTQKPIKLAEWFFEHWGTKKKNIVDLYLGSGSTLIACEKTNRKCFGMEIDPHYCSVIIERWQKFTGKEASRITVGETVGH